MVQPDPIHLTLMLVTVMVGLMSALMMLSTFYVHNFILRLTIREPIKCHFYTFGYPAIICIACHNLFLAILLILCLEYQRSIDKRVRQGYWKDDEL